jgi:hypothetical protein
MAGQAIVPRLVPLIGRQIAVIATDTRGALDSDMLPAFALREAEFLVTNQSLTDHQIITRLWDVLDDVHLNRALGIGQNFRTMLGPKKG